jgi:hypothetical protein
MSARETLIGVGLAAVLVVGIVDAAAGHDGSSKSTERQGGVGAVSTPTSVTSPAQPTQSPTKRPARKHHHIGGATPSEIPTSVATSVATSPAPATSATSTPRSTSTSGSSVPPGVLGTFSYATTGGEQTNIPGTSRGFPKTTTITNKLEGCGVSSTWKPIPQHVQKQVLCPANDGLRVKSYETTISFYGVSSGENFRCSGPSYIYRDDVKAGDTWSFKCKSADATAVQHSEAVGFETIKVGGSTVRTLHVHVETKLQGQDAGSSSQDYWIWTKKPVLVKETGKVTADQQNVHYSSTCSLALKSLSPKT